MAPSPSVKHRARTLALRVRHALGEGLAVKGFSTFRTWSAGTLQHTPCRLCFQLCLISGYCLAHSRRAHRACPAGSPKSHAATAAAPTCHDCAPPAVSPYVCRRRRLSCLLLLISVLCDTVRPVPVPCCSTCVAPLLHRHAPSHYWT